LEHWDHRVLVDRMVFKVQKVLMVRRDH